MQPQRLAHLPPHVRRIVLRARGQLAERAPKVRRRDRPRCGAKTRRGTACRCHAIWDSRNNRPRNGRCKMHGGLSSGPKTSAGIRVALKNLEKANAVLHSRHAANGAAK